MPRNANYLLCAATLACLAGPLWAADTEHRDFVVFVGGKEAGQSRISIVQQDDGTTYVRSTAKVKVRVLFLNFSYEVDSQEWWKADKLVGLKTQMTENGTRTDVAVSPLGDRLRVSVNGQERGLRADVWTSSFWKLADARYHNGPVPILDVDTGKEFNGQLQFIGTEQLQVAGQPHDCYRFRVAGIANTTDVWFDRFHRVVRQEFTESGQRTIVQLLAIRR